MPDPATRSLTVEDTSTSAGPACCCDAGCDVDGHARDFVVFSDLDLTGVEAHPYLEAERPNGVAHRAPALDCSSGSVEGGDEAIAPCADLPAAEPFQLPTDGPVVSVEEVAPLSVARLRQVFGGRRRCP